MKQVLLNMKANGGILDGLSMEEAEGHGIQRIKGKADLGKRKSHA